MLNATVGKRRLASDWLVAFCLLEVTVIYRSFDVLSH